MHFSATFANVLKEMKFSSQNTTSLDAEFMKTIEKLMNESECSTNKCSCHVCDDGCKTHAQISKGMKVVHDENSFVTGPLFTVFSMGNASYTMQMIDVNDPSRRMFGSKKMFIEGALKVLPDPGRYHSYGFFAVTQDMFRRSQTSTANSVP